MTPIQTKFDTDVLALLGRDPKALRDEYAEMSEVEVDRLVMAEHRALETMVERRSRFLAPTPARHTAVLLLAALSSLCRTGSEVDDMIEIVRDWIEAMGDIRAHLRTTVAGRHAAQDAGRQIEDHASLTVPVSSTARAVFDIHDERTILALLEVRGLEPIVVGLFELDDDDDGRTTPRTPHLTA